MSVTLVRHATLLLDVGGRRILVDPMLRAAGSTPAIEAIMCALALHDGTLPPTINYREPDPECDLDYVPNEAREAQVDVALSNAMGLGGHNGCVLLGRAR